MLPTEVHCHVEGVPAQDCEVFLHSRSTINRDEFEGYSEACPSDVKLVGIRVRVNKVGPRLFRTGVMPVMRGSFWKLNDRSGLLWGSGFKPRLGTYDGWETPMELFRLERLRISLVGIPNVITTFPGKTPKEALTDLLYPKKCFPEGFPPDRKKSLTV